MILQCNYNIKYATKWCKDEMINKLNKINDVTLYQKLMDIYVTVMCDIETNQSVIEYCERNRNKKKKKVDEKEYWFGGIYQIRNIITKEVYVGQAITFIERWASHKYDLRHNKHCNKKLQDAWNTYGEENFAFEKLEEVQDRTLLNTKESDWIILKQSQTNIYNTQLPSQKKTEYFNLVNENKRLKKEIERLKLKVA